MSQLALFKDTLPKRPYCANDLNYGLHIRDAGKALEYLHIQPNPPTSKPWLIYDIDRGLSPDEITDNNLPAPNLFVQNPTNGHAHLFYSLDKPVHMYEGANFKPQIYLEQVSNRLSIALGADLAYSGLISKNPLNEHWRTYEVARESYGLEDIAEYLDMDKSLPKAASVSGLGRNCDTFDLLRFWAYRNIGYYKDSRSYFAALRDQADLYNSFNDKPLGQSEISAIVKSVHGWTMKRMFNHVPFNEFVANTHTSEIQEKRRLKGLVVRQKKSQECQEQARILFKLGTSRKEIAEQMGVSYIQVKRWLAGF